MNERHVTFARELGDKGPGTLTIDQSYETVASMHIDIWSDVACPWCYLGLHHLRTALGSFEHADEVEIRLHAYFLDPDLAEPLELSQSEYLTTHRGMSEEDADKSLAQFTELGMAEDITFNFETMVVAPTSNAHRLLAATYEHDLAHDTLTGANTTQLALAEALDRAHFEMGQDVSDPEVLIQCAKRVGMSAEDAVAALADEQRAADVVSDYQIAVEMGVESVPTMLIDQKFVIQGAQNAQALGTMLATAWEHTHAEA